MLLVPGPVSIMDDEIEYEAIEAVVNRLLGQHTNDPELKAICNVLASWGNLLGAEPHEMHDGFLRRITQAHAEFLASDQKKKLIEELNELKEYFESETKRIRNLHEESTSEISAAGGGKAFYDQKQKLVALLTSKHEKVKSEMADLETALKSYGYTDELSDESIQKMEKEIKSLEEEYDRLTRELGKYRGAEPNEFDVRRRIKELRLEIEQVEDVLRRGTSLNQSQSEIDK